MVCVIIFCVWRCNAGNGRLVIQYKHRQAMNERPIAKDFGLKFVRPGLLRHSLDQHAERRFARDSSIDVLTASGWSEHKPEEDRVLQGVSHVGDALFNQRFVRRGGESASVSATRRPSNPACATAARSASLSGSGDRVPSPRSQTGVRPLAAKPFRRGRVYGGQRCPNANRHPGRAMTRREVIAPPNSATPATDSRVAICL